MNRFCCVPLFLLALAPAWGSRTCVNPEQAADHAEKDICITAHVYDVVQSADGTRFLDVCKPEVPDSACRFTVMSLPADRKEVGELDAYRSQDIHIRGVVHVTHGESVILLSHARQFHDGAEKFRPNPALLAGFGAESSKTAFRDPAMTAHRNKGSSTFMGTSH